MIHFSLITIEIISIYFVKLKIKMYQKFE